MTLINGARCGTPDAAFTYLWSRGFRKSGKAPTPNRYAGTCFACGYPVPAGAGCIDKSGDRWVVYC
jgi:hypothetical protein